MSFELDLPSGWTRANLGDFISFQNGYAFKSNTYIETGAFVIRIGNVQDGFISLNNPAYIDESDSSAHAFKLRNGDILISLTGNVGRVAVINEAHLPAVLNQRVARLLVDSSFVRSFIFNLMRSDVVQSAVLKMAKGAAQLNISTKDISNISVQVPPLAEQQVIADKLDTLLAQVESIKARLERIPEILKQFRQSVLAVAVSGKLTEGWRELNDELGFPDTTWEWILRDKKNSFKRGPFGSALKKSMFVESGFKVYEQYCPINDDCSYARYYITPEKFEEMKSFEVLDGDFLISCSGVSLGRITQVPEGSERGIINQALLRVRLNNQLYNDEFFKLVFRSPNFQKDLFENSTGSAIPNLKGVKELKAMVIPLPSLNEQEKIVELVNLHFEMISDVEKCVQSALDRINNLTQSILTKAFRGELTAEWRKANPDLISGENSAEALLDRIKAERSARPVTKRGKGKA